MNPDRPTAIRHHRQSLPFGPNRRARRPGPGPKRADNAKNAKNVYWGSGNYIWNNTGDTATLRNASGKTVDTCS